MIASKVFLVLSLTTVACAIVRLELAPSRANSREELEHFQALLNSIDEWIPLSEEIVMRATELRTQFGLASLDAIHVASAEKSQARRFVTTERITKPIHRITEVGPVVLDSFTFE